MNSTLYVKMSNYMPMITIFEFQSFPEHLDRVLAYVIKTATNRKKPHFICLLVWIFFSPLESAYPNLVEIINF